MKRTVYLYVCNTMADWEVSYLTAELYSKRYFKKDAPEVQLVTVASTETPIRTMGGLTVVPDITVTDCALVEGDVLVLPGGDTWLTSEHDAIMALVKGRGHGTTVAAICGATMRLAQEGVLNSIDHTSNDKAFLKAVCPGYRGEAHYRQEPAVTDGGVITASGIAPLAFTVHLLQLLEVFTKEALEAWYALYKTGSPEHFYTLMAAVQA